MQVSLTELYVRARKAARGSGLPVGITNEAAQAATWLCSVGVDGGAVIDQALQVDEWVSAFKLWDAATRTFHSGPAAVVAPSALDVLLGGGGSVTFAGLDAPTLVLGFAGMRARAQGGGFRLTSTDGESCVVSAAGISGEGSWGDGPLVLERVEAGDLPQPERLEPVRTVDTAVWTRLGELAARTYVPATEESRLRGAGPASSDDD